MSGKKYSKILTVLLIIIIIAVIGLLAYLGYNAYKKNKTEQDAADFVGAFTDTDDTSDEGSSGGETDNALVNEIESSSTSTEKTYYKGYEVLGTIEIPATDVEYPILKEETSGGLEVAVCLRYMTAEALNTEGNVVIAGHNYRNGTFFSDNKKLTTGDKIYITDLNGDKVKYEIYDIFEADETDTSFYNRDTDGKTEITLTTCNDDVSARIIILAAAEEDTEE